MEEHITIPESLGQATQKASGALHGIKEMMKNGLGSVMAKVHEYKGSFIEIGIYLAIGFAVGFLLKKYLKYILLLILFIVSLVILEQFDLVHTSVNLAKMQELFNLQPTVGFDTQAMSSYMGWIKTNFLIVLSASIGFLIGLKVG